jgi:hypothetical protein
MADGTEVVPEAVRAFGRSSVEQQGRLTDALPGALMPVMGANLGASGMPEAREAAGNYATVAEAAGTFIEDTLHGLTALAYTSATVAYNYEQGDTSQQAQMASVQSSFAPPPGTPTIASEQAAAEREQRRLDALARRTGEDLTPEPTWADGPQPVSTWTATGAPNPFTAARDAVTEHQRDLAEINGDDLDDLQASDPVGAEVYSPQQEYDDAVEEAEYLEQYTGADYEVNVEHGVVTVDPTGAGPAPSAGLG